jgi:23S rRNA pseudouridine2605 synthase
MDITAESRKEARGMAERLQKLISGAGLASRRAAEEMILQGRVQVNGVTAHLGQCAQPGTDTITVDGTPLPSRETLVYIMLNKPSGYVTTASDEKGRRTVMDLVRTVGVRLYPVGRLDMYSEGLLLLTNDGELAHRLMHPSHHIRKTYEVWVSGPDIQQAIQTLRSALIIDGYRIKPAQVELITQDGDRYMLQINIGEGRNRQIRKMCALANLKVHRLCRISQGALVLGDLPSGKWRSLTEAEIHDLRSLI